MNLEAPPQPGFWEPHSVSKTSITSICFGFFPVLNLQAFAGALPIWLCWSISVIVPWQTTTAFLPIKRSKMECINTFLQMKVASVVLAFAALWKGAWDKYNGHWCQNFLKPDLHTISCSSPLFKCFFLRQSLELLMCSSHIQVSQLRATIRYYCTFLALAPFRTKQDKMLIWFDYVRFLDPLSERTSHSYIMQLGVLKIDMQVLNILEKFICLHNPLRLQKTTAHASGWAENRIDYTMYVNLLIWYIISILSIPLLYPFLHQFCPQGIVRSQQ